MLLSIPHQLPHSLLLWLKLSTSSSLMDGEFPPHSTADPTLLHPPAPQSPRPCQEGDSGSAESISLVHGRKPHSLMPWGALQQHQHKMQLLILSAMAAELQGQQAAGFPCTAPCIQAGRGFPTFFPQPDTLPGHSRPRHQPLHASFAHPPLNPLQGMSCQTSRSLPQAGHPQLTPRSRSWQCHSQDDQAVKRPTAG